MARNRGTVTHILIIVLLGEPLVLLTFIELLMSHGSGMGVQGMATAANITKSKKSDTEFANSANN